MGTQNRLTEAYLPDKTTRGEKVIIGLSGGADSMVSAYLLKIQKYDLIAVTVAPAWEELGKEPGQVLACAVSDKTIERVQAFCHQLGVPHVVVKIPQEFRERIVERWVARKVQGELPDQCWDCHSLRMEFLHAKMKELGGVHLATGHFGKIFHHDAQSASIVQASNDELHDQSALLSRLPEEILRDLLLPLSDLQKKEVLKLAENFGIEPSRETLKMFACFPKSEESVNYLTTTLPERFRSEGGLFKEGDERCGDHDGAIFHAPCEPMLLTEQRESLLFYRYQRSDHKILLRSPQWFVRNTFFLKGCRVPPGTSWSAPFRGIILREGQAHEGWFFPKTLAACIVEFDAPVSLVPGETLTVMKKRGKNARVLLTGEVSFIEEVQNGDVHAKVDYGWNF